MKTFLGSRVVAICVLGAVAACLVPAAAQAALPSVSVTALTLPMTNSAHSHTGLTGTVSCAAGTTLTGGGSFLRRVANEPSHTVASLNPTQGLVLGGTAPSQGVALSKTTPPPAGATPFDLPVGDLTADPTHWFTDSNFTGVAEVADQFATFGLCATGGPAAHTVVKTATTTGANASQDVNPPNLTIATCPSGTRLIGGGAITSTPDQFNDGISTGNNGNLKPMGGYPSNVSGAPASDGSTAATSWTAFGSAGIASATDAVTAYALCSTDPATPPVQVARTDLVTGAQGGGLVDFGAATCPGGTRLIGGGFDVDQTNSTGTISGLQPQQGWHMVGSFPATDATGLLEVADGAGNPQTWASEVNSGGVGQSGAQTITQRTFAMCATAPAPPPLVFSSTPPSPAVYGASYAVSTSGGSGDPVLFSIAAASASVCALAADGSTVNFTGAGTCTVNADQAASGLHAAQSFTVSPAALTITAVDNSTTYGAGVPAIAASYSGFVNGDGPAALDTPPTCSTVATSSSPVGSYASTCAGASSANYTISYVAGTLVLARAPLTITASDASVVYGAALPPITASYSGFVLGESSAVLTTPPTCTASISARSTSCAGASADNYAISYVDGTLTVIPAHLKIIAPSASVIYGDAVPASLTPTYVGLVNGDSAPATAGSCTASASTGDPVGTYAITCAGAADPNYTITTTVGVLTITKRKLTITASPASMAFGDPSPVVTPIYSGLAAGQDASLLATAPTCSAGVTAGLNAGTYAKHTTCSGAVSPNFTFTYVAGTLTVTKPVLTVTAPSATIQFGAAIPSFSPTYSGLVGGATAPTTPATCTTVATSSTAPGTKPIVCKGAADRNYTVKFVSGTLTITKAATSLAVLALSSTSSHPSALLTRTDDGTGVAAQKITFAVNGAKICTATTDATGLATCATVTLLVGPFTASYVATAKYLGSTAP